jgi:hypothetical protein
VKNTVLSGLYGLDGSKTYDEQFSDASLESVMIFEVAAASATVENLVEMRKAEIDRIVLQERYGYKGWYERMMRAFQFGDDINELEEKTYYDVIDSSKQIIKYAYCEEKDGGGILLKVAKEVNLQPAALSTGEYDAALAYINRVKPAGIAVELRSENADLLDVDLSVRYNPLLFTSADVMKASIKTAINNYLKGLEYNGAFVGMKIIDSIQEVAGIEIVQIDNVMVSHAAWQPEDITNQLSYIPYSGYLTLNELNVTTQ